MALLAILSWMSAKVKDRFVWFGFGFFVAVFVFLFYLAFP